MDFENFILESVAKIVGNINHAKFSDGTLFVSYLDLREANKVADALREIFVGHIGMGKIDNEWFFDFIA
jgi:membrane-associated HD superfamily phosphohydrolase